MQSHFTALTLFCLCLFSATTHAQLRRNWRPSIVGQHDLQTDEDHSLTIQLSDLEVLDFDNQYPNGFTLRLYGGKNYSFSENTVTPDANFNGKLTVPVTVNDGNDDSRRYNLTIQVKAINDPPEITGQGSLATDEDKPVKIEFSQITVKDPDNNYPRDFSLKVSSGTNYTVSGTTVTPAKNFNGTLSIPLKVSDGSAESNSFQFQVKVNPVNDPPVITGQAALSIPENKPFQILLSHLKVSDPDDTYPSGFSLAVSSGNNYSVSGNTITPAKDFTGPLAIKVTVNDGHSNSNAFNLKADVYPVNNSPEITGQAPLTIKEDESVTLRFEDLKVKDPDNPYPNGFTMSITNGANYTINKNTILPAANYNGNLSVKVTVSDGENTSDPFNLKITVTPVNDPPEIKNLETEPLNFEMGRGPVACTETFDAVDVDDPDLLFAEIRFDSVNYKWENDRLIYDNSVAPIRGAFDSSEGTLVLLGRAPVSDYVKAIREVQYNCENADDGSVHAAGTKSIYITLSDGKDSSAVSERVISIGKVNIPLEIPACFTPNGDYANDTWQVKPVNNDEPLDRAIIKVYNAQGGLVYQAVGLDKEWDGKLNGEFLPTATYYYTIDLNLSYTKAVYKGLVTIIR